MTTTDLTTAAEDAAEAEGLPRAVGPWLNGATPEELAADASDLADVLGPDKPDPSATPGAQMNAALRSKAGR
jgi:hypothetical protein